MNRKEKHRIRQNDRAFFIRKTSLVYMEDKDVDHDWDNGCVCRLVTHKENVRLGLARGEWNNRGKK